MLHRPQLGMKGPLGPPPPFDPPPPPPIWVPDLPMQHCTLECIFCMVPSLFLPFGPRRTCQGQPSAPYVAWRNWQTMSLLMWYLLIGICTSSDAAHGALTLPKAPLTTTSLYIGKIVAKNGSIARLILPAGVVTSQCNPYPISGTVDSNMAASNDLTTC